MGIFSGEIEMNWFVWFLVVLLSLGTAVLLGYYAFLEMVANDIIWTRVESGWRKIIMRWGKHHREVGPGLHLIGIPGMHTLFSKTLKFFKAVKLPDGSYIAEPNEEKDTVAFKDYGVVYTYSVPFLDDEDSRGLPLRGSISVHGSATSYEKLFFVYSTSFAEVNARIERVWRDDVLPEISWADIVGDNPDGEAKKKARTAITKMLWAELSKKGDDGKSVVEKLDEEVGFKLHEVNLVAIDPPVGWREITLAAYKAQKEKEAAIQQAAASAASFDDTNQALEKWLVSQRTAEEAGHRGPVTKEEIAAKARELRDRALAKTSGYQQVDIRGLESASTAVVGGGNAGLLVSGGGKSNGGKPANESSEGKGKPSKKKIRKSLPENPTKEQMDEFQAYLESRLEADEEDS